MKYYRSYPWWFQFLLFLLIIFVMVSFAGVILILLPKFTTFSITQFATIDANSPAALVRAAIILQGIQSVFIFLIPPLLFAYFAHPEPAKYLGLKRPGKWIQLVLVVFIMLGATPVLQKAEELISHIDFGAKVKADQAANDNMMSAFLNIPTFSAFIRAFIVMAIIPAIGEEMFFRGILLRFAKKHSRTMLLPILFTAAFFAVVHSNIYGYLSIFLAGVLLAVIYNLTGSLWCSITGHMFFNGLQIVVSYMSNTNNALAAFMTKNIVPWYLVISGGVVFAISFYLLLKNKTPLPATWANDFTPEEISQKPY